MDFLEHARSIAAHRNHPLAADDTFLADLAARWAQSPTAPASEVFAAVSEQRIGSMIADHQAALATARREAAAAERERIRAITSAPEAKLRRAAAHELAFVSDLPAAAVIAALAQATKSEDIFGQPLAQRPALAPHVAVAPPLPPVPTAAERWAPVIGGLPGGSSAT